MFIFTQFFSRIGSKFPEFFSLLTNASSNRFAINLPTQEHETTSALTSIRSSLKSSSLSVYDTHLSTITPMVHPAPKMLLNLTHVCRKSTNPSFYRAHFHVILNFSSDSIICYTDGSKIHNRVGFAYSVNDRIFAYRHRNAASVIIPELQVIFQCLTSILSLLVSHSNSFLITLHSLSALTAIFNPYSSHSLVTQILTLSTPATHSFLHVGA